MGIIGLESSLWPNLGIAINIYEFDHGIIFFYGTITLVLSRSILPQMWLSPYDTGIVTDCDNFLQTAIALTKAMSTSGLSLYYFALF